MRGTFWVDYVIIVYMEQAKEDFKIGRLYKVIYTPPVGTIGDLELEKNIKISEHDGTVYATLPYMGRLSRYRYFETGDVFVVLSVAKPDFIVFEDEFGLKIKTIDCGSKKSFVKIFLPSKETAMVLWVTVREDSANTQRYERIY